MGAPKFVRVGSGLSFLTLVLGLLISSCQSTLPMQLVSNVPNTVFSVRDVRIDDSPDERWKDLGEGQQLEVRVPNSSLELRARAPGYREKVVRLTEPIPRREFEFLEADRDSALAPPLVAAKPVAPPVAPPAAGVAPFTEQRHALIVGISTYQRTEFKQLNNARRDAEALANFLRSPEGGNIASSRVHVLLDEQATRPAIIGDLMRMTTEANQGDLIIIYFAGHARVQGGEGSARFLMPFDADGSNPHGTAIDEKSLVEKLNLAQSHRQMLMLDCCFAGGATVRGEIADVWGSLTATARVVLTSTKGNETSWDGDRRSPTGPFMTEVLKAFSGELQADENEDGRLTADELYRAIGPPIKSAADDAGLKMTPQLYGDWAGKIEIVRLR